MKIIGYIAGTLTLVGYLPKTIDIIYARRAKDLLCDDTYHYDSCFN